MIKYFLLLLLSLSGSNQNEICNVNKITIPASVEVGDNIALVCEYDIGDELLYSIKWYKERLEFYRFLPRGSLQKMFFPVKGVTIDKNSSSDTKVILTNVKKETAGKYSCEVSTEAPYFQSCSTTETLTVKGLQNAICSINKINIPASVNAGDTVTLVCEYDIGDELLYSIKWYKKTFEFYRYVPTGSPQKMYFPVKGVTIDVNRSSDRAVILTNVQNDTSGNYSCEVVKEAPSFQTCLETETLTVNVAEKVKPYVNVIMPEFLKAGGSTVFFCKYKIGNLASYTVKWYKDNMEIFRYTHSDKKKTTVSSVPGVYIDVTLSSEYTLTLRHVEFATIGKYQCEVSTGPPQFLTLNDSRTLDVIVPNGKLIVTVNNYFARLGDKIEAICSVPASHPQVNIDWFLNGDKIEDSSMAKLKKKPNTLIATSSITHFVVGDNSFENNKANLTCVASIGKLYKDQASVIIEKEDTGL